MPASPHMRSPCQGGKAWTLTGNRSSLSNTKHRQFPLEMQPFVSEFSKTDAQDVEGSVQCLLQMKIIQMPISHFSEVCPNHRTRNEEPLSSSMQQSCCSCIKASPYLSPQTATTLNLQTVWHSLTRCPDFKIYIYKCLLRISILPKDLGDQVPWVPRYH